MSIGAKEMVEWFHLEGTLPPGEGDTADLQRQADMGLRRNETYSMPSLIAWYDTR